MRKLWLPSGYVSVRALGLDADGVLRDTGYQAYSALCWVIKERGGKPPTYADYILKDHDYLAFCAECGARFDSLKELNELYYAELKPEHKTPPFRDVAAFCQAAGALGLDLFVVSSSPGKRIINWFDKYGLGAHFGQIIHSSQNKEVHLKEYCEVLGVEPDEVAYVGDKAKDAQAAIMTGCVPVGITRGYEGADRALRQGGARLVVHSLEHLSCLIS